MKKLTKKVKAYNSNIKAFRFYAFAVLFLFSVLSFTTAVSYAETLTDRGPVRLDIKDKPSTSLIEPAPTTELRRKLIQAGFTDLGENKKSQAKKELKGLIEKINSVEFQSDDDTLDPLIVLESIQKDQPEETTSDTEKTQEPDIVAAERKLPPGAVTDKTLELLKKLSKDPAQLNNPFQLAEVLFKSNCFKEASECYRQALDRINTEKNDQFVEKAWLLFQIGNCLRDEDPQTAVRMYQQLIDECPNSPWVDLAHARSKLIDWRQKDKPDILIEEFRS